MSVDTRMAMEPERRGGSGARRCLSHRICLYPPEDSSRVELEHFVRDVFAARHAANVCSFMPALLAMRNDTGAICGVAGFRSAAEQPLFLERYFDEPIERVIASLAQRPIARSQVVEVGNLAGVSCRSAMRLVLALPRMLLDRGHRWIVFTATDTVRELLQSYHAPLLDLGPARADRVQGLSDDWGHYYDTNPRVMVGYLPDGMSLQRHRTGNEHRDLA